ncbi:hypothetical protein ACIOYT_30565 [Streptomyces halstedii]|uniref:hypothetical protein n=1 Tax=Streptomyces halstedii TaxID=1944 RepID=UPI003818E9BF
MNTGTWPVCRGAQHLTQADIDDLMAKASAHPPSAEQRAMLDHTAATLRQAMDRRDRQPAPSGQVLAAVAGEWHLLRHIAHRITGRSDDAHVIWANPFVYMGPYPKASPSREEERAREEGTPQFWW